MKKQFISAAILLCFAAVGCKKNNTVLPEASLAEETNTSTICKGKRIYGVYCQDVYKPVCGCDGVTYSNSCYAYIAGVKSYTNGECGGGGGTTRTK
jgi:Kazal-type serine protease inhibitor domain